jgi:glutaredoxin-like protein NrdH
MFCDQVKEYLSQEGLQFEERDVATDPGIIPELTKLGHMATPIVVIGGSIIVGFDRAKIAQALDGKE